ncbi:hypothetical protein, partial [Cryobacterium sinapicolor]|uniref:hypothetical protein n=1 Tax=Cryobacterium sinapicolor TaxID=1259236 RepID=UPI001A7E0E7F
SWTNSRISAALNPGLIDIPLPPTACEVTHKQLDAEGEQCVWARNRMLDAKSPSNWFYTGRSEPLS